MPIRSERLGMMVSYTNVQMLHGLAAELWRQNSFDLAFETLFNASCVLQEVNKAEGGNVSAWAADILDDLACMKELQGDYEEAYNFEWLRLKVLTGLDNPMQQEWTVELREACQIPHIAHTYSGLSALLIAKGKEVADNAEKAVVFFSEAMNVLQRCHMFKDNDKLIEMIRLKIVSYLKALGRLQDADAYETMIIEKWIRQNDDDSVYRILCFASEKIFYRPQHGGPPVVMPLDDDMAGGPVFLTGNVVHDAQQKQQREEAVNALNYMRSIGAANNAFTANRLAQKMNAAKAFAAKKLEADRVFEELLQEEESKFGAKETRMSKRQARRLQKAKHEQTAADAGSQACVSAEPAQSAEQAAADAGSEACVLAGPAQSPEQRYRAALESLDASLQCPLTLATMRDPVVTQYGHSFEREEIELWFKTKDTCPMTGVAVTSKALVPNIALKTLIVAAEALREAAEEARALAAVK